MIAALGRLDEGEADAGSARCVPVDVALPVGDVDALDRHGVGGRDAVMGLRVPQGAGERQAVAGTGGEKHRRHDHDREPATEKHGKPPNPLACAEPSLPRIKIFLAAFGAPSLKFPRHPRLTRARSHFVSALDSWRGGRIYVNVNNIHTEGRTPMQLVATLDEYGKPAWITAMIVGFILWWPIGLGVLAYLIWSGRMGCGNKMQWKNYLGDEARAWRRHDARSARPAIAPSTTIARRPCGVWRRRRTSSRPSCSGFVTPRTRPSSTSSWPSAEAEPSPRRHKLGKRPCERATSLERQRQTRARDFGPAPFFVILRWPRKAQPSKDDRQESYVASSSFETRNARSSG